MAVGIFRKLNEFKNKVVEKYHKIFPYVKQYYKKFINPAIRYLFPELKPAADIAEEIVEAGDALDKEDYDEFLEKADPLVERARKGLKKPKPQTGIQISKNKLKRGKQDANNAPFIKINERV